MTYLVDPRMVALDRRMQCGPQAQVWKSKVRDGYWEAELGDYRAWAPSWGEAIAVALAMHKRSKRSWFDAQ